MGPSTEDCEAGWVQALAPARRTLGWLAQSRALLEDEFAGEALRRFDAKALAAMLERARDVLEVAKDFFLADPHTGREFTGRQRPLPEDLPERRAHRGVSLGERVRAWPFCQWLHLRSKDRARLVNSLKLRGIDPAVNCRGPRPILHGALVFLFCSSAICLLSPSSPAADTFITQTATVFFVEDGDTFLVRFPKDPIEYVANLMAVDAAGPQEQGGDCYAREAAEFLRSLILNREVTVTFDSGDKVDRRGRLLVYVEVDGKDVNAEMIRGGYGWVPRPYPADRKQFYLQLEKTARTTKKGLWGVCPESYLGYRPPM